MFGSSEPLPGHPLYESARAVGSLLAARGITVVSGGYGGVMEGASRGAVEAGGRAVGVLCRAFVDRRPNPFLTEAVEEIDLLARTRRLIEIARGFVVLPGKSGTLAELTTLWAMNRAGSLGGRPVVLLGDGWRPWVAQLVRDGMLEAEQFEVTRVADTVGQAVDALETFWGSRGEV